MRSSSTHARTDDDIAQESKQRVNRVVSDLDRDSGFIIATGAAAWDACDHVFTFWGLKLFGDGGTSSAKIGFDGYLGFSTEAAPIRFQCLVSTSVGWGLDDATVMKQNRMPVCRIVKQPSIWACGSSPARRRWASWVLPGPLIDGIDQFASMTVSGGSQTGSVNLFI